MNHTRNVLTLITLFVSSAMFLLAAPAVSSEADWITASVATLESELVAEYSR